MSWLVRVGRAVWDFVVGDDWLTALGVALMLGITAVVAGAGATAWWIMPAGVILLLAESLRRATK